jgi:SAM-dependent methyltransferase
MQKQRFVTGEADAWFRRNREHLADPLAAAAADPVVRIVAEDAWRASRILEIGAGTGWRVSRLCQLLGAEGAALDPSSAALAAGRAADPAIQYVCGTADRLPFPDGRFDLVVFGFCLYLCDLEDLFRIGCEADRVLSDGGRLVIYDFHSEVPYRRQYRHADGLFTHKMDFGRIFDWHPAYRAMRRDILVHPGGSPDNADDKVAVSILRKDIASGYLDRG